MRVALSQPAFQWATERSAKIKGQQNHKVKILLPSLEISDSGSSTTTILDLPCSFEIPSDPTDLSRFLDDEAVFEVFLGNEKQHVYTTTVRECIPIFQTRKIEWTHQEITVSINSKVELSIRPILGQMMKYKNQSYTIANQVNVFFFFF
jgi:hypothetical protein